MKAFTKDVISLVFLSQSPEICSYNDYNKHLILDSYLKESMGAMLRLSFKCLNVGRSQYFLFLNKPA